jgi:hypothetical protein
VARRETETEAERNQYMYRQTVTIEDLDGCGAARGAYREVRGIVFSPRHERTEEVIGRAENLTEANPSTAAIGAVSTFTPR